MHQLPSTQREYVNIFLNFNMHLFAHNNHWTRPYTPSRITNALQTTFNLSTNEYNMKYNVEHTYRWSAQFAAEPS